MTAHRYISVNIQSGKSMVRGRTQTHRHLHIFRAETSTHELRLQLCSSEEDSGVFLVWTRWPQSRKKETLRWRLAAISMSIHRLKYAWMQCI